MPENLSSWFHHKAIKLISHPNSSYQKKDQNNIQPGNFYGQNGVEITAQNEGEIGANLKGVDGHIAVNCTNVSAYSIENLIV